MKQTTPRLKIISLQIASIDEGGERKTVIQAVAEYWRNGKTAVFHSSKPTLTEAVTEFNQRVESALTTNDADIIVITQALSEALAAASEQLGSAIEYKATWG